MTAFEERFKSTAAPPLLAEHGESIVYTPAVGSPRTITAIVSRTPLEESSQFQNVLVPSITIKVLNDATDGIASATLNCGGDHVTVAVWEGQAAVSLPIASRVEQTNHAMLELQCGGP